MITRILEAGRTPVVHAYVLGRPGSHEILTQAGLRVVQHPLIYAISAIYRAVRLRLRAAGAVRGAAARGRRRYLAPPRRQKAAALTGLSRPVSIGVTGWAVDPACRWRLGVDYAVPLSDHADFDELIECVERVEPGVVYCTHGPAEFVTCLRKRGHNAHPLEDCHAGRPFRLIRQ